jgi:hypothetical protein
VGVTTETSTATFSPIEGSQYVNPTTGQEFVYDGTMWIEQPCCGTKNFQGPATDATGVDSETSTATFPPTDGSQYVNPTTGQEFVYDGTMWIEQPCCASPNFQGGATGIVGVTTETSTATFPPIEGSQYINPTTGQEFVYDGVMWIEQPCCAAPNFQGPSTDATGVDSETSSATFPPKDGSQYVNPTTGQEFVYD